MWDVPVSWVLVDKNVRVSLWVPKMEKDRSTRIIADLRFYQVMSSTAIIFPFTVFFAKVSILLIYLRLFKIDRPLRVGIHVGLILMALFHTAIIGVGIGTVIKCVGVSASTSTFCNAASGSTQLAQSAFNVVTDFLILILPMPLVMKLQLPRTRKIGLFFVFGAGVLYVCVLATWDTLTIPTRDQLTHIYSACGASLLRLIEFSIRYNSTDTFWDHAIGTEVRSVIPQVFSCFDPVRLC